MAKHINLGNIGETPKKMTMFNRDDAPSSLSLATPQRNNNTQIKGLLRESKYNNTSPKYNNKSSTTNNNTSPTYIDDRPKTSRGKAMPSPDEFTSYVIPSPPKTKKHDDDDDQSAFDLNQWNSTTYPKYNSNNWYDDDSEFDINDYGVNDDDDDDGDDSTDEALFWYENRERLAEKDADRGTNYCGYYYEKYERDYYPHQKDNNNITNLKATTTNNNDNSNTSAAFSTSFRHSNQDELINFMNKGREQIIDYLGYDDGSDYYDTIDYDDGAVSPADDDDYDINSDNDINSDDDLSDYGIDFRKYKKVDDVDNYDDDKNPILEDDRIIALGCWLFGSAIIA